MSASAPFALSSKCVTRLSSDPDVIVENGDGDSTEDSEQSDDTESLLHTPRARDSTFCASDGRTESGWIFRNSEENVRLPSRKRSCNQNSEALDVDQAWEREKDSVHTPQSTDGGPGGAVPSSLSLRRVLPFHSLPHPSELRKKSGAGIKRNRELDKEHPVTKHIQQLKKKKVAYFCQDEEGAMKKSPQTTAATSASGVIDAQTPVTPPALVSPRSAAAAKRSPDRGVAAVPPTVVPVTEDDDDSRWFRSHWGSQLLAKSFSSFEE